MLLLLTFAMGVANFAMHRALLASRHPILRGAGGDLLRGVGRFTLPIEFAVLLAALAFAARDAGWAVIAYAIYTAANAIAAWLIFGRRQ